MSQNDLGCYGNQAARTPELDRLAYRGRRFDNAILTASSCSPSRSSVITGRYPHNNGRASELHQPIAAHLPWFPRLLHASPAERDACRISYSGKGLHWDDLDEDISVEGLLAGRGDITQHHDQVA